MWPRALLPLPPWRLLRHGGSCSGRNAGGRRGAVYHLSHCGNILFCPVAHGTGFRRVGDKVKNGQTVCILEAMKLMNEIQCEYDCEIEAVLVSNEQKVEYGQPLFRVKKL